MRGGFCILRDERILACDSGFLRLLWEVDGAEVFGKPLPEICPEDIRVLLVEALVRATQSRGLSSFRLGETYAVAVPLFEEGGGMLCLAAVLPERALSPWHPPLRHPSVFAFFQDPLGRIAAVSEGFTGVFGGRSEFDFPEDVTCYLSPVEISRARQAFVRLAAGQPILGEYYIFRNSDSRDPIPARVTAIPVFRKGGEFFGVVGYVVPSLLEDKRPLTLEEVLATLRSLEKKLESLAEKGTQSPGENALSSLARLTPRQVEVLRALALGHSTREAAQLLGLSTNTVETHRRLIMRKLNLPSLAHLVRAAVFLGLVPENPWEDSRNP